MLIISYLELMGLVLIRKFFGNSELQRKIMLLITKIRSTILDLTKKRGSSASKSALDSFATRFFLTAKIRQHDLSLVHWSSMSLTEVDQFGFSKFFDFIFDPFWDHQQTTTTATTTTTTTTTTPSKVNRFTKLPPRQCGFWPRHLARKPFAMASKLLGDGTTWPTTFERWKGQTDPKLEQINR